MSEIRVLRRKDNTFLVAMPKLYVKALGIEQGDYLLLKLVKGAITIEKVQERPEKVVDPKLVDTAVQAERKGWERWITPTAMANIDESLEEISTSPNTECDEETPTQLSESLSNPSEAKG